jgi:Tol biopolymer transport system component
MTPERWAQVERLYHAARVQPEGERAAFVADACAGDEPLRREVESLLAQPASAAAFLREPAIAIMAQLMTNPDGTLLAGRRLGAYHLEALLGAGGMGEVYRARDTVLGRDVAIKILPRVFTSDADRLARFEREARLLASLNHPHIGAIYGFENSDDFHALVLELVEGDTLADRLAAEPLPVADALPIARQIADALEAAHEKGIVHRDLKPANIKITPEGVVKVLDFGLAKAAAGDEVGPDLSKSPTITVGGTREGVILGTAAYMSPEQARGKPVDKRADIWAFGCVLYEMLTGRRAFEADDLSATIAFVITKEPDWSALPIDTPASIRKLLRRCLEKDRKRRLADIADASLEIEDALTTPPTEPGADAAPARRVWTLAVVFLLGGVVAGIALWLATRPVERDGATPVTRLLLDVRPAEQLGGVGGRPTRTSIALSPDGRSLAFSAVRGGQRQIYLRQLSELAATPIAGTDGGSVPFFSPDGQSLGYWASGELRKVSIGGGVPVTVSKIPNLSQVVGASWGSDGRIVFARITSGLWQVSAEGGMSEPLTSLDSAQGEVSHRLPHVLPGGDAVVFTVTRNRFPRWNDTELVVYSRRTGKRTVLIKGGADARYVATGHLIYVREGVLMAAPFDLTRLEVTGGSVGVIPNLMQAAYETGSGNDSGAAQFTVSQTGTLAYIPGGVAPQPNNHVILVDRTGRMEALSVPVGPFQQPRLSPDGKRFAVFTTGRDQDIWVDDMARSTFTRLTTEGRNASPVWTPDGTRIAYRSGIRGVDGLFWRPADGSGAAEPITLSERNLVPGSWSPDGQVLAFYDLGGPPDNTGVDIWVVPMNGDRKPRSLLATPFFEGGVDFSPDGQWLAYESNESGRREVYVRAYPGLGARQMISTAGGMSPIWRRDGQELVYIVQASTGGDNEISVMAVPVTTQPVFRVGTARRLFAGRYLANVPARNYDVTPDGTRFLMVQGEGSPPITVTDIVLVQNWTEELKRLMPTTR